VVVLFDREYVLSKCYLMNLARISSLRADSVAFEELSRAELRPNSRPLEGIGKEKECSEV